MSGSEASGIGAPLVALDDAFSVVGTLTKGTTAKIQLARQLRLDRAVALKRPLRPGLDDAHLLHEARIAGRLPHRAIVPVHGLFAGPDGEPVMAMKLLTGRTWSDRIRMLARPATRRSLRAHVQTALDVALALEFAHERGILHLDVKPANVVEGHVGDVHLVDWGSALELGTDDDCRTRFEGTPSFAAPEAALGAPLDARTDVYLLGGCLYAVLYGRPPHRRATPTGSIAAALEPVSFPDSADRDLQRVVERALSVDPDDRWQRMADLRTALQEHLSHDGSRLLVEQGQRTLAGWRQASPIDAHSSVDEALGNAEAALDLWAECPDALTLIEEATTAQFELNLAAGNLDHARRAHETLTPDPDREARLQAAVSARHASEAAQAELDARRRRDDPDAGARRRSLLLAASWSPAVVLSLIALWFQPSALPSPPRIQLLLITGGAGMWVGTWWMLRHLIPSTSTNDALVRATTAAFAALFANRLGCWFDDVHPIALAQADVLLIGTAFASFDQRRRGMVVLGLICAAATVGMALRPDLARVLFLGVLFTFPFYIAPSLVQRTRR